VFLPSACAASSSSRIARSTRPQGIRCSLRRTRVASPTVTQITISSGNSVGGSDQKLEMKLLIDSEMSFQVFG
jgi:hypothetical protein